MGKKIGISQRVKVVAINGERRDCLDQRWVRLMETLGFCPVAMPNALTDVASWIESLNLDGFVLSGGNDMDSAPERNTFERFVLDYASRKKMPVLGVCRGLQMMNLYCGGELKPIEGHLRVRHQVFPVPGTHLLQAPQEVNSFHSNGIAPQGLGDNLVAVAVSREGDVEAIRHNVHPWVGVMWHPESESDVDSQRALFDLFSTSVA